MYYRLAIAILLAGFFAAHATFALGVWFLRPTLTGWSDRLRPSARARVFLLANVGPLVGAAFFGVLLLASYLLFEPRDTKEEIGWLLILAGTLGAIALLRASYKSIAAQRATLKLAANWTANAVPISLPGWHRPAYRLDHIFPLIAVVGVWRPRLFVAGQVLDQLAGDELVAAIAHENGHLLARDNLKRMLVNFCAEMAWWVPVTRTLRRMWADAAEQAADEYAATGSAAQPLNLAAALVKLARMTVAGTCPAMPAGAFLIEAGGDILTQRVNWLVEVKPATTRTEPFPSPLTVTLFLGATGLCFALAVRFDLLERLHQLIETVVQ